MEDKIIVGKISEALINLEEKGELVLTTSSLDTVARFVFHSALESWFDEIRKSEEPIECTIPYLLEQTVLEVAARFAVQNGRATEIVNSYYNEWFNSRTMKEIAEIYWHETPREMAGRAYYRIVLGKPDNRDLEYLEWRKSH
ncbi:hypothetical protein [Undibacterium terreum]|uniref:Uncharacterized protein n=1 Tax=Undibacterium terreum TaxID=1224302 RepID=A0A916XDQ0_9BURK|nr:hypothetical protein [Undibacterium terreum]GGC64133.1 hypothetical protein GCM10011396_08860 [Undibacterium terreum]